MKCAKDIDVTVRHPKSGELQCPNESSSFIEHPSHGVGIVIWGNKAKALTAIGNSRYWVLWFNGDSYHTDLSGCRELRMTSAEFEYV